MLGNRARAREVTQGEERLWGLATEENSGFERQICLLLLRGLGQTVSDVWKWS